MPEKTVYLPRKSPSTGIYSPCMKSGPAFSGKNDGPKSPKLVQMFTIRRGGPACAAPANVSSHGSASSAHEERRNWRRANEGAGMARKTFQKSGSSQPGIGERSQCRLLDVQC